jgi:serine/threonine protein kinase
VGRVADEFLVRREAGHDPSIEEYAARYPQAAGLIRRTLAALNLAGGSPGEATATNEPVPMALGDFRIVREVGRGGMGVVYEGEQLSLHRRVALKVLPFAAVMDPRHLQRFRSEALAAAALDHPNVVKVYGVGQDRGVHFIAMQFIDGRPLSDLIRERQGEAAPSSSAPGQAFTRPLATDLTPVTVPAPIPGSTRTPVDSAYARRVAEWAAQAAEALEHAHSLGVVHRDVKPSNLLLDGRGELYVADFGLARVGADLGLTGTGDLLGTPRYMSPEQAAARHGLVDHRSDVYSLGASLYELLTLTPVFGGTDPVAILRRIADNDPTPPRSLDSGIPRDLETVVLKCLNKDPAWRYQTALELADDLRRFLATEPVRARRRNIIERSAKWLRRHSWKVLCAMVLLAATVGLVVKGQIDERRAERARQIARAEEVIHLTREISSSVVEMKLGTTQFMLTGQREFLVSYTAAAQLLPNQVSQLVQLTAEGTKQRDRAELVAKIVSQLTAFLANVIGGFAHGGPNGGIDLLRTGGGKRMTDDLRSLMAMIEAEELKLRETLTHP